MKKGEREEIEWINTWWSKANTNNRRGLLIGDSTIRQLRGSIEVLLINSYAVDLFASSFSIHDKRLVDCIDLMFNNNEYQYDFIILNYGGHHGFSRLCSESLEVYAAYQEEYEKLLKYLMEKCKKVVCMTGTSEVLDEDVNVIDQIREQEIIIRNRIVQEVAGQNAVDVFDLYSLMKKNRDVYSYHDRQHFNRSADYFISYHLVRFLLARKHITKQLIDRQCEKGRDRLINDWGFYKKCMIYGTGNAGIGLYWLLKWYDMENQISCFVVSSQITQEYVLSKPVISISSLTLEERKSNTLIIASDKYRDEMHKRAKEFEIKNVVFFNDIINGLSQK